MRNDIAKKTCPIKMVSRFLPIKCYKRITEKSIIKPLTTLIRNLPAIRQL